MLGGRPLGVPPTIVERLGPGQEGRIGGVPELFDRTLSLAAIRAYLADDRNVFLLASVASAPAGFLRGTTLLQLASVRPQMFLYEIGVRPEFRRRGVARELIRTLLSYCRDRGFEEVFVMTQPSNEAAVGLYRSTGAAPESPSDRLYVYRLVRDQDRGAP